MPVDPRVVRGMVTLVLLGGVATFVAFDTWFFVDIWRAHFGKPPHKAPKLNHDDVYVATTLGGLFGTFFAVTLGVNTAKKNDGTTASVGSLPSPYDSRLIGTLAFVAYSAVGIWALITFRVCSKECPVVIKTIGLAWGGFALTLISTWFAGTPRVQRRLLGPRAGKTSTS